MGVFGFYIYMTKEAILSFVRDYYIEEGKAPSVRAISEAVEGVDRGNFYNFFASKYELLDALGIEPDESDMVPVEAMEARLAAKAPPGFCITLNERQSRQVLGIAFLEGEEPSMVIDDMLRDQRDLREVLALLDQNVLNADIIRAILNPKYFYRGINISSFAHKPWLMLPCTSCRKPVVFSEVSDPAQWRSLTAGIKEFFPVVTHNRCGLKMPRVVRGLVR